MTKQCPGCGAPLYHMRDGDGRLYVRWPKVAFKDTHRPTIIHGYYRCSNCEKLSWRSTGKTEDELTQEEEEPLRWL